MTGARLLSPEDVVGEPPVLLVPDGTWSQARKLLQRDPDLQRAEIVTLPPGPPSRYGLRRNAREGTLCTLEAIARALGIMEGREIEARLMSVLDLFVGRSLAVRAGIGPEPCG
jgi:DTW domain-containing protein YfiP